MTVNEYAVAVPPGLAILTTFLVLAPAAVTVTVTVAVAMAAAVAMHVAQLCRLRLY